MSRYRNTDSTSTLRRRLLAAGAAAGASTLLPSALWAATTTNDAAKDAPSAATSAMRTRAIPSTGEQLAVMGLGSSGTFSYANGQRAALRQVLDAFVAHGGEMVDTSPTYGNAETVIGELARDTGLRDELFMATKVHIRGVAEGKQQMDTSAERLGKPVDLMQIHNFVDLETQWATLKARKAAGRYRYIGITHYLTRAFERLEQEMRDKALDFVQFNYSIMTPEAEQRLLPLAADRGIAVIVNRAFNDGQFFRAVKGQALPGYAKEIGIESWAQFALKYVLAEPAVNVVIPATADPKHLVDNMGAGTGPLPDDAMRQRMRRTVAELA